MSKIDRPKIPVEIITIKYKLTKVDNESFGAKFASQVAWIEWGDDDRFKSKHDEPEIGRALIMDPQYGTAFTWLTTTVTEIIEKTESFVVFKTKNSHYKLERIGNEP
jgi:hypothetical protein